MRGKVNKNHLPKTSYIYFIGNLNEGVLKIGRSIHPTKRLKELQTGCSFNLFILKVIPGNSHEEVKWHNHFANSKCTGEWYKITPQLQEFLDRNINIAS